MPRSPGALRPGTASFSVLAGLLTVLLGVLLPSSAAAAAPLVGHAHVFSFAGGRAARSGDHLAASPGASASADVSAPASGDVSGTGAPASPTPSPSSKHRSTANNGVRALILVLFAGAIWWLLTRRRHRRPPPRDPFSPIDPS